MELHIKNDPNGSRTRVAAVKGRCPRPLDDGVIYTNCFGAVLYTFFRPCQDISSFHKSFQEQFCPKMLFCEFLLYFKSNSIHSNTKLPCKKHNSKNYYITLFKMIFAVLAIIKFNILYIIGYKEFNDLF